jgi:hypothetical protein
MAAQLHGCTAKWLHVGQPIVSAVCLLVGPSDRPISALKIIRKRKKGQIMSIRPVKKIITSKPTMEGAGVKLRRAFGFGETSETDPFLLLDDFRNDHPEDYKAGFPWHPHRGIETITYVLAGNVELLTASAIAAIWAPVTCNG